MSSPSPANSIGMLRRAAYTLRKTENADEAFRAAVILRELREGHASSRADPVASHGIADLAQPRLHVALERPGHLDAGVDRLDRHRSAAYPGADELARGGGRGGRAAHTSLSGTQPTGRRADRSLGSQGG